MEKPERIPDREGLWAVLCGKVELSGNNELGMLKFSFSFDGGLSARRLSSGVLQPCAWPAVLCAG